MFDLTMFLFLSCSNKSRISDVNNKTHSIHPNNMDTVCFKLLISPKRVGNVPEANTRYLVTTKTKDGSFLFRIFSKGII